MRQYFTRDLRKRTIWMLIGVTVMGITIQFLNMTQLGPDPYSAMNYGISGRTGISFGTCQMTFNLILFLLLFWQNKKLFGLGTIGNMIVVGYAADLTGWVIDKLGIFPAPEDWTLGLSIGVMIPALIVFMFAAALYMNCGLGTSPYDALPYLLHQKIEKAVKKTIPFKITRIVYDGLAAVIAFLIGGDCGIVTVLMVFFLGPCIDVVSGLVKKSGIFTEK